MSASPSTPTEIRRIYDRLGIPEAERKVLAGVGAQYESEVIYHKLRKEWAKLGVIFLDMDDALRLHPALVKKYFMHGTSHHLGLDVHDVNPPHEPFAAGMVLTIEPGIYIREEGLGIRLENDVVIGPDRNLDLMAAIPIEAEELEELMQARG